MASEYDRKFEEMKNYIPFLESMIKRLESTSGSTNPRKAQLDKIRSLRDLLLDKKKRMKMENLLKCEQVLVNLYAKVEQRDTLPGIDLKIPTKPVAIKDEPDLDLVRNKLKIVTKLQEETPGTLPEIARANESQDTSTAGKEPALFQRRPNSDPKNPPPKRNYTRVLVSPEPSPQRWSKHDDKKDEKPLFSRRSPRRQSPPYHKKDRRQSKRGSPPKSKDLNITLKVPEEKLDSLNTSDIFSRIINCRDNDVDIATLREIRSQILGELKHTGAKDDISDLILNSSKKKKKKKSHKRKEEVEEGELSDSESEAIENIYGSLVIVDKDQNASDTRTSNKQDQKPRKIQIRLVINSENEAGNSDSPNTSDKKSLVSDLSDVSEFEMFDKDLEKKVKAADEINSKIISNQKEIQLDDEIAPRASELPDDEIAPRASELPNDEIAPRASELPDDDSLDSTKKNIPEKRESNQSNECNAKKASDVEETNKSHDDPNSEEITFKPNFYKPLTEHEPENKDKQLEDITHKESKSLKENKDTKNKTEVDSDFTSGQNDTEFEQTVSLTNNSKTEVPNKSNENVEIPLLNEPSVASHKPKESVVSEIDILQALKNEILSDSIAIPGTDPATPALHQPKLTKVANTQEIVNKKRISIENYKKKVTPKPAVNPLFTSQSSKDKDDQNRKQSLKLTEKECERFKIAISNDLSSEDDDLYDELNKSGEDDIDLAPKSPDNDDSNTVGNNTPVIIPADPVKNIVSSKADVDMRTLMPILSPISTVSPLFKENHNATNKIPSLNKPDKIRPSDPRLKRDQAPLNIHNEPPKPVPPPMLGLPIVTPMPGGVVSNLIPNLSPSPNMTPTVTVIPGMTQVPSMTQIPNMTPSRVPNMTPIRAPNMTPSMTPNSKSYEIDDQPKRKHVYASLYDDLIEDIQKPPWEMPEKSNQREPRWEQNEERDRNQQSSLQDRSSKNNQEPQKYNRHSDPRSYYRDDSLPMYRRTDAPMTPSHPFGRAECPSTPSHPFGRAECPPTPSHPFGRSECPPTPSHPFGRLDCPPTPTHHFGRSEALTSSHSFGRADCPMTPSHPFGRSECPPTPSHSFGRSECPPTPSHSFGRSECPPTPSHPFGRSEMPMTPSHPFGRIDRDPRLQKANEYDSNAPKDDRNRRHFNDHSSYKPSPSYNPKHDLNSKQFNENYRNYRERSVGRSDRPNYYKEQSGRSYKEERGSRHDDSSGNRSRNYEGDQYNARGYKTDDSYNHDKSRRFREEPRPNYQRERSVGRTNSIEDRQVRSNSRAHSVSRKPERDEENTLSVKSHAGRSFTIDTSVNATFQDFMKSNKEKSIFDQLFDRRSRASSVGRTLRETSVGRTLARVPMDNAENINDRLRRARSVVRDTESKSFSEVKADFESYRSKSNVISIKINNAIQSKKPVDRNSPRIPIVTGVPPRRTSDTKQPNQYSPRKNYRDPRLNRDPRHDQRLKLREDKHRYDDRDKKKYGIVYSNDNIASGTILGSGYGVKNYKIPKIKRVEEPPPSTKTETMVENKKIESKPAKGETNKKSEENIKNKEKESDVKNANKEKEVLKNKNIKASDIMSKGKEKESDTKIKIKEKDVKSGDQDYKPAAASVKSNEANSEKKLRRSSRKSDVADSVEVSDEEIITRPRRTRRQIRESGSESEESSKTTQKNLSEKQQETSKDDEEDSKNDQGNDSLDTSFGMDDLGMFTDNATSDPVIDSINSLIADLDKDINSSKNANTNKFTNEISLENMLENITCQSHEEPKDISIDSALKEINKLTGSDESQHGKFVEESDVLQKKEEPLQSQMRENLTKVKITEEAEAGDIENKTENKTDKKLDIADKNTKQDISSKDTENIVSTTNENITNEVKDDENKEQTKGQTLRSTTPDSTNTDSVPMRSTHIDNLPDSTDEVHSEVSEVSSSNTSGQLPSKDPEPNSFLKEGSSTANPLGNILSILQSKSKIKELLSMLGDQSSDNDKIKKKLEKLSEIVSDEEDDAEQQTSMNVDQESRDGTEIENKEDYDEESKDLTEQYSLKQNQNDDIELKECTEQNQVETEDKDTNKAPDSEKDETSPSDERKTAENIDAATKNITAMKKNKVVKKVPIKRKGKKGKFIKRPLNGEEKRVTRSELNMNKSVPAKKRKGKAKKSELLKLQEDIKEMFISDDVLNVTGIRMCRLAKLVDDNSQKDMPGKSDVEPVVVLEKINKTDSLEDINLQKSNKTKSGLLRKKPGPKSKVRVSLNESSGDADEKAENARTVPKYKPGPKSKKKLQSEVDPYEFEADSVNESNASKASEGSARETSDSESESLTSLTSFGSSEALSELKTLTEMKKKPKRKRSSWKTGVIKPKNKKKKPEPKSVEPVSKNQAIEEKQHVAIPDYNCFTDKKYCYLKNVFTYSCRLCTYSGEEIVAHYKKEHPHTEIPLSRLSPEVAKEAIEQCEEINFQAISKIPTDKYVCRFCYKEFGKKKAALESFFWHVVSMHTGEYKQICSECVNITRCPFNLDIPPPPKDIKGQLIGYICGKCNFTQISLENLKTHVIVRHNDEQTEVYTINLAVMSRKIINLLSKRASVQETDKPRVLRSSRSNQSMTEMSDDRSDITESNSGVTEPETLKDEIPLSKIRGKKERKASLESKSKIKSKITFENDDSDVGNSTAAFDSEPPVKIEKDESDDDNREEMTNATLNLPEKAQPELESLLTERESVSSGSSHPHFKVNYTDTGTGIELMCYINVRDCTFKGSTLKGFRSHVNIKHREDKWDGYCFICKEFVNPRGQYLFKDGLTHFIVKHMDNEILSEVYFRITYSEVGLKQYLCYIDGNDHYQCSSLISLKRHVGSHKEKWNGYCCDCKTFVKPKGAYFIEECLTHYLITHNMDTSSIEGGTNSGIESCAQINSEASLLHEKPAEKPVSDIFAYPHFKVAYTDTGSKEFVCCINLKDEIHYKTSLLISFKRHVQTKHSENWDGYCFVCKVIVMPQGRHLFKDCLQHFVDKHMDDFPVLKKQSEPEKPVEEPPPPPRPYINVRPLSQLKGDSEDSLVLPKIESVISLGATSAPTTDFSAPESEINDPEPPVPAPPESETEEFHNYEASQVKVMSQKHPVVQEAMLRKEKLVRVFKCAGSYCSFATDSADMALSHALAHQRIGGENALCCSYCDFDCSGNAIDLVVHVFKHACCPYTCGYCFYRAAAAQLVVAHSNIAHVGKPVKVFISSKATVPENDTAKMLPREAVVQYYVCKNDHTLCKFKTYTARKFCEHLQTRHPCSEHSCYICAVKYQSPAELIQHMKAHDLNLYQCTWCVHGADSEADLLAHAASRHPTHQPQSYLRIITNKEGSSEMRVLPLASFNKSSVGVEHVVTSTMPDNPVKEAERSLDLQKLIGQTKLMFETLTSNDKPEPSPPQPVVDQQASVTPQTSYVAAPTSYVAPETSNVAPQTPQMDDMATIVPNVPTPASKTPPRTATPQAEVAEQTTPILKSEPAEITPSKVPDEIVCLDSDEEEPEPSTVPEPQPVSQPTNVIDISEEDSNKPKEKITFDDDQVFKCPKCLTCYKTDTGLKLHILKCYNPSWPMACPHCHQMTANREALLQHYFTDHCKKYKCEICRREMHSLKSAKTHFKMVHKINKVGTKQSSDNVVIVSKDTGVAGPTRAPMKRKLSMTNTPAPPPKQIKRYGPQDVDQLPINPILDDLVYCSLCEFNTKVRLNMVRHLQLHAESQPVPQTAPVNPVPHLETNEMHFDKMVNLASSSIAKEKTKEVGPLVSQLPPEAAARYPKYVPERQRYTCGAKDCSYISLDEAMLRCHWDTLHSDTVDYRCVHCPPYQQLDKSKPLTAPRIMMHLKMHDTSLYACSLCTYYHFKRQIVEKHLNDAHKGSNGQLMIVREEATGPVVPATAASAPTMDLKPWQCGLCSFKSMLRPEVAEHCSKNHQSKMQFKCAYCPFRTSTFENVVKHQTNSHPARPEEIFYYYYREGSVPDEDGTPKWMKQRQKMGITDDPVVKTEVSEGTAAKSDPPVSVPVNVDLNIVKKEQEEKLPEGDVNIEELCRKFGQFCEPNGLKYKCPLCTVVTEDTREAMQSHLFEELQYRRWRCSICSYKAFHKNGLNEHIGTEHRGRMQEPIPINLPQDEHIERWVAELLRHQTLLIEKNRQNLLGQKVQTPGPTGALNAPQKAPENSTEPPSRTRFSTKELEDAFGQFGVANNKEYCCPKCVFRTEREEVMREHLESELTKIRWCCSACTERSQNYHNLQFHCKSAHATASARPVEVPRNPYMRAAWVTASLQTQKRTITAHVVSPLLKPGDTLLKTCDSSSKTIDTPEKNTTNVSERSTDSPSDMHNLVGQKVQTPTKQSKPQTEKIDVPNSKFSQKELEDAFGQFGVANNMEFCCPKCVFRAKKEEVIKDHLESELTKIRWCCSNCPDNFQTYHEAQFHCKSHAGLSARPREAARDPGVRAAWVAAVIQVQKAGMKAATNENVDFSPNKRPEEDSLLVVRYEEKVPIPEPTTSRPVLELSIPKPNPEPSTSKESPPSTPESDDDDKLVIDEINTLKRVGKVTVCPHCLFQSKNKGVVKEHLYRHYGLYPYTCEYCEFTGYRYSVVQHLDTVHPHENKKFKATPIPKGQPTVANIQKRRRKNLANEWRFCLICQMTFSIEKSLTHKHGDRPVIFVKHGDIIMNCKACQTYRKDFELMKDHYASEHPDKAMNYFIYQILYSPTATEAMVPIFKRLPNMPTETIDINDDDVPPPKKVARKSTTKLPMQAVAKKSTTKLPCLYISEDEEYSYYGNKPTPIEHYENVTTLMTICNTTMPFTVKKMSEILKINPRVVVKDVKK